jgi:penicillin G amidase
MSAANLSSRRWLSRLVAAVLIVAGVAAATAVGTWFVARRSFPKVSGSLVLPGLTSEVRVVRDRWGIPHIFARNELDAFRALGFTAAQDRLFQMDIHRRLANGELSEIVGPGALQADELARTFGFRHYADELLQSNTLSQETLSTAEAYLEGLNYYISLGQLPLEFKLLRYQPKPFKVGEMLAFAGYMAYGFSEAFRGDILYSDLLHELPPAQVDELRARDDDSTPTIAEGVPIHIDAARFAALHGIAEIAGTFSGSNSWVAGPKRSKSGFAILANDPHIGFSKPAVWYEAHLMSPTLEIYGHFLSFMPFPILGHTRNQGWAITMSEVDDMDFYRETINPENPSEILFKGHWTRLDMRRETIHVKGDPDVQLTVRTGPHGPFVQDLLAERMDDVISVKWQYHEPRNRTLETFYDLAHANSIAEFAAALQKTKSPGLNISYADRAGNIAWWVMGQIPIRPPNVRPDAVLDGASGADEYLGYVPFEDNPHVVNPDNGLIITANNKPSDTSYPLHGYFQPSERIVQLHRLLDAEDKWSPEEFMQVQTNQDEVFAADQVPLLLSLVDVPEDPLERSAYERLQRWDGHSDVSSNGAMIYNEWRSQILRNVLLDELGTDRFSVFCSVADAWHFYKRLIRNPGSAWWDDVTTADRIETREEIVARAYHESIAFLRQRLGPNVDGWTWGKLHTIEYVHPLGRQTPLHFIFNAGPYPAGGNYSQVDAMASARGKETFEVLAGPSTRRIVDFGRVEKSWGISPLGNSGNLLSPHEKDQVDLFLRGQYRAQLMDEADITRDAESTLLLSPSPTAR